MKLLPRRLVVFEGLDKTGKSTQAKMLAESSKAKLVHMPSGNSSLTRDVYRLTETNSFKSNLARQFLHLACHAEFMQELRDRLHVQPVILDRWWWSTVAYGWYPNNNDVQRRFSKSEWIELCMRVWHRMPVDIVFLFLNPYELDNNNNPEIKSGFEEMGELYKELRHEVVMVPQGTADEVHKFIVEELHNKKVVAT